jgi:hypothetical protein
MFVNPNLPNLPDYLTFLRQTVGIQVGVLPDSSVVIQATLDVALQTVDDVFLPGAGSVGAVVTSGGTNLLYCFAVYNLATDRLINFAPDVSGQTYFQDQRTKFRIFDVPSGVPSQASDGGTAVGILNPEFMKKLTMGDLQTMKTPWGRHYIAFALAYGPSLWGVT